MPNSASELLQTRKTVFEHSRRRLYAGHRRRGQPAGDTGKRPVALVDEPEHGRLLLGRRADLQRAQASPQATRLGRELHQRAGTDRLPAGTDAGVCAHEPLQAGSHGTLDDVAIEQGPYPHDLPEQRGEELVLLVLLQIADRLAPETPVPGSPPIACRSAAD